MNRGKENKRGPHKGKKKIIMPKGEETIIIIEWPLPLKWSKEKNTNQNGHIDTKIGLILSKSPYLPTGKRDNKPPKTKRLQVLHFDLI